VGLRHRVPANRQHFAATYVLPTELADRIRREYPDPLDAGPALQGLRQWLRLAILTDEPMGMPSLSVQSALAHFLSYGKAVDAFRRGACPGQDADRLDRGVVPNAAASATMALTWAMACNDQQKRPEAPEGLPWLFAADEKRAPDEGWRWTVFCGHEPCAAVDHCVHHNLLPHLPKRIPHQIHFGLRPPHPLMDKSDAPFGGGAL
jgi:hypothetical protein